MPEQYQKNNQGLDLLPGLIWNWSKAAQVYMYLVGHIESEKSAFYVTGLNGDVGRCQASAGPVTYSFPLPTNTTEIKVQFPRLMAGRLYYSLEAPLYVTVGNNGIPSSPAGWLADANYKTEFDFIEFDWQKDPKNPATTILGCNTTQVDMFGLPFGIGLTGLEPSRNEPVNLWSGFKAGMRGEPGIRDKVFRAIEQAPIPWNGLAVGAGRTLCPYKAMELGRFPRNQLDDYINQVWKHYETAQLKATGEGKVPFVGTVKGGKLVFTSNQSSEVITFPKPTTFEVYTSGPLSEYVPEHANGRRIRAYLQAAFMRSTLLVNNDLWACDSSQFYKNPPINLYAKTLHDAAVGGFGAYAFGFDDACSISSYISVRSPGSIDINLLNIGDQ